MYAFVMRPESLPKSYRDFIQKTGPVAEPVYKAVRDSCRGGHVDLIGLSAYFANKKNSNLINLTRSPSIIPCSVIHPDRASCLAHNVTVTSSTFKKTFPLYFSLTFVPYVVLRLQKVTCHQLYFLYIVEDCCKTETLHVIALTCVWYACFLENLMLQRKTNLTSTFKLYCPPYLYVFNFL